MYSLKFPSSGASNIRQRGGAPRPPTPITGTNTDATSFYRKLLVQQYDNINEGVYINIFTLIRNLINLEFEISITSKKEIIPEFGGTA